MIVIVFKNDQNMLEMSFDIAYIGDAGRYTTMIITLTLNPSIDYTLTVDEPLLDVEVNRTTSEQMKVGGKGLNVSMMLDKLQIPSRAIALLGGFTGDYIEQALQSYPRIDLTRVPDQRQAVSRTGHAVRQRPRAGSGILCPADTLRLAGRGGTGRLGARVRQYDARTGRGFPDWAVHESASAAGQTGHRHGSPVAPVDRTLPAGLDQTQLLRV